MWKDGFEKKKPLGPDYKGSYGHAKLMGLNLVVNEGDPFKDFQRESDINIFKLEKENFNGRTENGLMN